MCGDCLNMCVHELGNNISVTIVVPVFKVSEYIERCIRSVLSQTYRHIECIIVDDASPDDSIDKCERLISVYDGPIRFRILHHECNRGLSAARNTGTEVATGDYVYYLDSDDEITPDCLEQLVAIACKYPAADMIMGNHVTCSEDGDSQVCFSPNIQEGLYSGEELGAFLEKQTLPATAWNKLLQRDFLNRHRISFKEGVIYEDRLWFFHLSAVMRKAYICKDVTYHYYHRPNSIVTGSSDKDVAKSYAVIYDEILHHLTAGREMNELKRYVEGFSRRYLLYRALVPEYNDLWREYWRLCEVYGCESLRLKLGLVWVLARVLGASGGRVLQWMSDVRGWWRRRL